jgi:elongator complex protein 2
LTVLSYVICTSLDQTTRIHGPTPDSHDDRTAVSWHEIGRPQVHGYDLVDAVFLDVLKFVSIADEKVARVFEAPRSFVDMVRALGTAQLPTDEVRSSDCFANIQRTSYW